MPKSMDAINSIETMNNIDTVAAYTQETTSIIRYVCGSKDTSLIITLPTAGNHATVHALQKQHGFQKRKSAFEGM